jgi:hypothetical protein
MKKMVVLAAMVFIIFPKIFAGDNSDEIKKCYFLWQLYSYIVI